MGDNSKKPGIRFKGFTDDWEQRKFADYYKMSSGYAFKMTDYCDDGAGLITVSYTHLTLPTNSLV